MNNKALELLETKIWLIRFKIENDNCTPKRIKKLLRQHSRLQILRIKLIKIYGM